MTQPEREARKLSFERVGTIIGVISGAIGLLVTVVGLPGSLANALGRSESAVGKLELAQKRAAVKAAEPRLDVMYVFITTDIVQRPEPAGEPVREQPDRATTIRSYPLVTNEIIDELKAKYPTTTGCGVTELHEHSIGFLVISNRGQRDAADVTVSLTRFRLRGPVLIDERTAAGRDYVAKLRGRAGAREGHLVRIPLTLGPGDGVRVPLWISAARFERHDRWCIVSRTALTPESVSYADPVLGSRTTTEVRRMVAPTMLALGVYGRG